MLQGTKKDTTLAIKKIRTLAIEQQRNTFIAHCILNFSTFLGGMSAVAMPFIAFTPWGKYSQITSLLIFNFLRSIYGEKTSELLKLYAHKISAWLTHYKAGPDILPEGLNQLVEKYKSYHNHYIFLGGNIEDEFLFFLRYLKEHKQKDGLIALAQLGADKDECLIKEFEAQDAKLDLKHDQISSLRWLAAKACHKGNKKRRISEQEAPSEVREVIESSKKYARFS